LKNLKDLKAVRHSCSRLVDLRVREWERECVRECARECVCERVREREPRLT
jgi:hypothetical protein